MSAVNSVAGAATTALVQHGLAQLSAESQVASCHEGIIAAQYNRRRWERWKQDAYFVGAGLGVLIMLGLAVASARR